MTKRHKRGINKNPPTGGNPVFTEYCDEIGRCIYCGKTNNLQREHIIPYFMAGQYVIPDGSCVDCAKVTKRFEDDLSSTVFFGLRERLNIQSRSRARRGPSTHPIIVTENGVKIEKRISADEMPAIFVILKFRPPGLIEGRPDRCGIASYQLQFFNLSGRIPDAKRVNGTIKIRMNPINLMRFAAKIAHGFLYFKPELAVYEPLLKEVILTGQFAPYFVGSVKQVPDYLPKADIPESGQNALHYIGVESKTFCQDNTYEYLIVYVHLFQNYGGPIFQVVCGRKRLPFIAVFAFSPMSIILPRGDGKPVEPHPLEVEINVNETGGVDQADDRTVRLALSESEI